VYKEKIYILLIVHYKEGYEKMMTMDLFGHETSIFELVRAMHNIKFRIKKGPESQRVPADLLVCLCRFNGITCPGNYIK
jgi:hypothetical protein